MKLNFKLLFTAMAIALLCTETETKDRKKIKYLTAFQLRVCGNETVNGNLSVGGTTTTRNLTVTNQETVSNLAVSGALTVGGVPILPFVYGSFNYTSNSNDPLSGITLTPSANSSAGAFTPFNNGTGTGVTVANAGTYFVWYYAFLNNDGVYVRLETNAGVVAGSQVDNTIDRSGVSGSALVTVAANGDFIILTSNDTTGIPYTTGSSTIIMSLLRLK